jgi:hypothetical protein
MFASKLMDSAQKSASSARDYAIGRANGQVGEFAAKLRTTSGSLHGMTSQLRSDPLIAPVAPLVEQAEGAFSKAASYLETRGVDKILLDVESLSRNRPVAATLVATLVGFAVSRAVKASSVKRYDATDLAGE